ncbi:PREDICTED: calfacilitin [Gekko japonicus]|uniref:Calfacilitin n=1 Tax=Gekko japonicus TaxID=146911 RepID=A0ABM1KUI6_GEKJA|nr:PREDICTED: calfacilitin [Gekko japonicus]
MGPWLRSAGLVAGSTLLFGALRWGLGRCPLPAHVRRDATRIWRWRNLLVSFVHSIVAGIWAVAGVWQMPEIFSDIVDTAPPSGRLLLCFASGYFIHDSLDIILCRQSCASWEYLVHHAMAVTGLFSGILLNGGRADLALRGGEQHLPDHPDDDAAGQPAIPHPLPGQQVCQPGCVLSLPPGTPGLPELVLCAVRGGARAGSFPHVQPGAPRHHDPGVLLTPAALRLLPANAAAGARQREEVPHRLSVPRNLWRWRGRAHWPWP